MRRLETHMLAVLVTGCVTLLGMGCGGAETTRTGDGEVSAEKAAPGARGDASPMAFAAPETTQIITLERSERSRLEGDARKAYDQLVNALICPCEGHEDESLAQCLHADPAPQCQAAPIASDTIAYHLEAGHPPALALDQALKDFEAASNPRHVFETHHRPRVGSPGAPVQLVVFEDFQCPFCRRTAAVLPDVLETFDDEVSLVFKHFPLRQHEHARAAALAATAAKQQGKFWEMHDALFEHQASLDDDRIREIAADIGLDMEQFERDIESPKIVAIVDEDIEDGRRAELPGTPTIYINGRDIGDDLSANRLERRIALELELVSADSRDKENAGVPRPRPRLIAQSDGVPADADDGDEVYPALSDLVPLLSEDQQARLLEITESEICPCEKGTLESLDKCLRTDDGGCRLAVQLGYVAVRAILEGETDAVIVDRLVQEVESARKVHEFELEGVPHKGADPDEAKLVLVEFADFKCHYCAQASEVTSKIAEEYGDDVVIYFKNFPLNPQSLSPLAARAALAAQEQGRFWEMHDLLFAEQDSLSEEKIVELAGQIGLNTEKFEAALDDEALAKKVARDRSEGDEAGIRGTPAFFIDGVRFVGDFDELKQTIEDRIGD